MPHDIQAIKDEFRLLANNDAKEAVVDLLVPLLRLETTLSADDIGWAFWNICDNYAMLRKAKEQYAYQSEFYEWSKSTLPPLRHHWVLSDATQALTLINGGFLDFWWNCYYATNESVPQVAENRTVRFESHRANAHAYTRFREFSRAEIALQTLEAVLSEDPLWVNRDFATVTLISLRLGYYAALNQGDSVVRQVEALDQYLGAWLAHPQKSAVKTVQPPLGSWEQLNADRPPDAIDVAIHNAACELAIAREFAGAERWFRIYFEAHPDELSAAYSIALYSLACWHNRHNQGEIRNMLRGLSNATFHQVLRFAPELTEVLGE